ncbi:MAG: DUF3047 domain-containing protein [Nitrospinae bacterium]|nr:DUF3047 domain-containing protein [Nitrospinota bacterium]
MGRLAALGLLLLMTAGAEESLIPPFSLGDRDGDLPRGWKALTFSDIPRHTDYRLVEHEGRVAVKAFADASASALYFETDADPDARLDWSWTVLAPVAGANVARKESDDAVARVYVLFAYDSEGADLWTRMKYAATRLIYGQYPPAATLTYIWSTRLPEGQVVASPYTGQARIVALRRGAPVAGGWVNESVRPGDDFRRIFHEEPPRIAGIGIMSDSDNTGGVATAWYADFTLTPAKGTTP